MSMQDRKAELIQDLNKIYDNAFKQGKLSVALKAKELLIKELKHKENFDIAGLSIQQLNRLIEQIEKEINKLSV